MKKIFILLFSFTLLIVGCSNERGSNENSTTSTDVKLDTGMEVVVEENEPLLLSGETLYELWAYTFIDVDGNGIAERISFTNVNKHKDDDSKIIARVAIEFDFASKNKSRDPIYIERSGGTITHPEIQCAYADGDTLIFVKDPYSASGEELYPFIYTAGGALNELGMNDNKQFPENAVSYASILNMKNLCIESVLGDNINIVYGDVKCTFTPKLSDEQRLREKYIFNLSRKENTLAFYPQTLTLICGIHGVIAIDDTYAYDPADNRIVCNSVTKEVNSIPVDIMITFQYTSKTFSVIDITVMSSENSLFDDKTLNDKN